MKAWNNRIRWIHIVQWHTAWRDLDLFTHITHTHTHTHKHTNIYRPMKLPHQPLIDEARRQLSEKSRWWCQHVRDDRWSSAGPRSLLPWKHDVILSGVDPSARRTHACSVGGPSVRACVCKLVTALSPLSCRPLATVSLIQRQASRGGLRASCDAAWLTFWMLSFVFVTSWSTKPSPAHILRTFEWWNMACRSVGRYKYVNKLVQLLRPRRCVGDADDQRARAASITRGRARPCNSIITIIPHTHTHSHSHTPSPSTLYFTKRVFDRSQTRADLLQVHGWAWMVPHPDSNPHRSRSIVVSYSKVCVCRVLRANKCDKYYNACEIVFCFPSMMITWLASFLLSFLDFLYWCCCNNHATRWYMHRSL